MQNKDPILPLFTAFFNEVNKNAQYDNGMLLSLLDFSKTWGYIGLATLGGLRSEGQRSANINTGYSSNVVQSDEKLAFTVAHELGRMFLVYRTQMSITHRTQTISGCNTTARKTANPDAPKGTSWHGRTGPIS